MQKAMRLEWLKECDLKGHPFSPGDVYTVLEVVDEGYIKGYVIDLQEHFYDKYKTPEGEKVKLYTHEQYNRVIVA
jgi:hypothetical protein